MHQRRPSLGSTVSSLTNFSLGPSTLRDVVVVPKGLSKKNHHEPKSFLRRVVVTKGLRKRDTGLNQKKSTKPNGLPKHFQSPKTPKSQVSNSQSRAFSKYNQSKRNLNVAYTCTHQTSKRFDTPRHAPNKNLYPKSNRQLRQKELINKYDCNDDDLSQILETGESQCSETENRLGMSRKPKTNGGGPLHKLISKERRDIEEIFRSPSSSRDRCIIQGPSENSSRRQASLVMPKSLPAQLRGANANTNTNPVDHSISPKVDAPEFVEFGKETYTCPGRQMSDCSSLGTFEEAATYGRQKSISSPKQDQVVPSSTISYSEKDLRSPKSCNTRMERPRPPFEYIVLYNMKTTPDEPLLNRVSNEQQQGNKKPTNYSTWKDLILCCIFPDLPQNENVGKIPDLPQNENVGKTTFPRSSVDQLYSFMSDDDSLAF